MRTLKPALTVIGAVTILVLAANTVVLAATGSGLVLGRSNAANQATEIKRTTNGPVLRLTSRAGNAAPLATNGKGRVANLNADRVDGVEAAALRTSSFVYSVTFANQTAVDVNIPVPNGTYLVSYSTFFDAISGAAEIQCYIAQDNPTPTTDTLTGYSAVEFGNGSNDPALSGSGLVVKASGQPISVHCDAAAATFSSTSTLPMQIVATRTKVVGGGDLIAGIG